MPVLAGLNSPPEGRISVLPRSNSSELSAKDAKLSGSNKRTFEETDRRLREKIESRKSAHRASHEIGGPAVQAACQTLVSSNTYKCTIAAATVMGVILVARETDVQVTSEEKSIVVAVLNILLMIIYICDVILYFFADRLAYLRSWNAWMDIFLVVVDFVLEIWGDQIPNVFAGLKAIRFLRLKRFLQTCTQFRELYLIMMGIMSSIRALIFGSMLMLLILSLFSILAVHFIRPLHKELVADGSYADCDTIICDEAFDTVMRTNLTFMSMIVAGDSWGKLAIPLMTRSWVASCLLLGSFMVINLGLLNTIVAVIVDRQSQARQDDVEFMLVLQGEEVENSYEELRVLFERADIDGSGLTTLDEIMTCYETSDDFKYLLNRIDVHKDDIPVVFDMLDSDRNGLLHFSEFVNGLYSLKYQNQKTLAAFTKHFAERVYEKVEDINKMKKILESQNKRLSNVVPSVEALLQQYGFRSPAARPSQAACEQRGRIEEAGDDTDGVRQQAYEDSIRTLVSNIEGLIRNIDVSSTGMPSKPPRTGPRFNETSTRGPRKSGFSEGADTDSNGSSLLGDDVEVMKEHGKANKGRVSSTLQQPCRSSREEEASTACTEQMSNTLAEL
eukprot:TRINITY_DN46367_c0_g1_i1.p1 TRINITY_DN46367_c0_g1~~TRINITY_DN46367_c0_g1_i1.p1  ORF type:complete len:642 (-),score=105.75 TRINITY_DN46367_c0_g1_i1:134-1981(-)